MTRERKTWAVAALVVGVIIGWGVLGASLGGDTPEPTPLPTGAQLAASRVAQCRADLQAVHDLWVRDPSFSYNPPSCNQPGVSGADYMRVFAEVGGGRPFWVTS